MVGSPLVVTSVVVLAPLLLHTVWGLGRLFTSRPNNLRYGYFENLKYLLQRLASLLLTLVGAEPLLVSVAIGT